MADEVPVCDVLCEAMEYLAKLGSNLRSRSESLKEKKIRKDRLKNSHAVQKAAEKVLMICELSKKSLENVETGIKKVLTIVDATQRSTGDAIDGKRSREKCTDNRSKQSNIHNLSKSRSNSVIESSENSKKYEKRVLSSPRRISISGKSYNIRLPRRVSLKHYMSVKVLAKKMPTSMMDKYPVFLSCNLYNNRENFPKISHNSNEINTKIDDSAYSSTKIRKNIPFESSDQVDGNNIDSLHGACKGEVKSNAAKESEGDKQKNNKMYPSQDKSKYLGHKYSSEDHSDEDHNKIDDMKTKTKKCKKYKKIKVIDDSSSSENEGLKKNEINGVISLDKELSDDAKVELTRTQNEENVEENEGLKKNEVNDVIILDKELNDNAKYELIKTENEKNLEGNEGFKKNEGNDEVILDKEVNDDAKVDSTRIQNEENFEGGSNSKLNEKYCDNTSQEKEKLQENGNESVKPFIKCVSITKLLKSDVKVKENEDNSINKTFPMSNKTGKENSNIIVHMTTKGKLKAKYVEAHTNREKNIITNSAMVLKDSPSSAKILRKVRYHDEEEFGEGKRKEVEAFKPKEFTVNVMRLPEFSDSFLYKNNLRRILQSGSVICELLQVTPGDKEIVNNTENSARKCSPSSTNDAKNALLIDSDEDIFGPYPPDIENIKNSLLDDSGTDRNGDQENNQNASSRPNRNKLTKSAHPNKKLPKNSNPGQDESLNSSLKVQNNAKDETEKVKSSLLEDSESDKNDNQENELPNDSDSVNDSRHENNNSEPLESHGPEDQHNKSPGGIPAVHEENKNEGPNVPTEDQDKELAKSSLLNDSSDSSTLFCPSKRSSPKPASKKRKHETSVKSRRKHIMESMHAKKMLLTYSSSSDTEDEQLKNVIKDIKDDLIKSCEDDTAKNTVELKIRSSSESDEDILENTKKKQKTGDDSSPRDQIPESVNEEKDQENGAESGEGSNTSTKKSKPSSAKMGRSREKPGGSGNQNSDSQEDNDIEGLTNLKNLNKIRRRRDSESEKSAPARTSARKMAKAPLIFSEENLLSPDSSGEGSAADSEDGLEEDLPPVSLSSLNGDGEDHLAKDDLLGESESDTSKDKSSDAKKEDDSDSSTVRKKRRKAKTISSDSEAGSSRRKRDVDAEVKVSDFEDSEDEGSEHVKRTKRKKKSSDSDASAGSSSDGKKKRKRIKQIDSDDISGSDTENEGKSKHGRKNIRKVMGKNQLEEATKKAAREEKERVARIAERQKMYNNLEFDESGKPDEVIVDKVILDFEPETKEPLIEVDRGLVKKLKPHQANGIKFMWDACFESVKRIKKDRGSGCILAHCMGLGKTLQVVSLTHTLLTHSDLTKVERVLVVCPLSTVLNWVNEFRMWLKFALNEPDVDVYELSRYKQNSERAFQLSQWFAHGGVCVLGYEMFRNLSADNPKKFKKKMLRQFQESLVDPGPDLVVCDEGHLLKNEKTSLSQSMNRVRTRRRIVLTGTPLQNNLKEYYCMVQFVKPNLLGKYNEYLNRFVNPITNGQYTDSTEHDIRIMKRRSHVLHKMLDGAVQRRDYGVLAPFLPPKHEYVLFITLTEVQTKLYQHYLDNYSRRPLPGKSSGFLFPDFQSLQRIWTHPLVLKYNSERYEIMQQKKREREEEDSEGSLVDFIDDDSTPEETSTEESSDNSSEMSDDSRKKSKKKKSSKKSKTKDSKGSARRTTRANPVDLVEEIGDPSLLEVKNDNPTEWWIPLVTDDVLDDLRNSHKLVLLFEILRQCEAIGDKLLVFSQSLYSLDLIEHFLGKVDEATQEGRIDEKLGNHVGSWSPGVDYFRLDGSTSCENRSIWCKNFNREDNPRARLFLISTRAGGLGINLVAANRVVIFDVSWNPSHDVQSIFRVYRFGQKKPCYIYRFLAMGTMEEKIYERQVTKQAISKRVIDEQQIDRHYAENDLAELYKFEPQPPVPRPVPLVPKDRLFAEMLKEHEAVIYKFHEHDSLLENKEEETLSEEERKAAWEDFENEKNRPPPQPFTAWPMHNGVPNMNLMAAQQQQLAYAALAGMLRKDMPTLSDDNIRQMLPLLYSSNPAMFGGYDYGLMQKLSEMYKYAQPGMMNPQMMNMNAGGAGGGGTSGLQYEPPWQRQQQQQQQLRLQQLMQQQNQMGAKFYAGGLGSRDPVAMALQQQRAREIMLGGGGGGGGGGIGVGSTGRPRGRPPLAPRAPPTTTNDVVNLDSD